MLHGNPVGTSVFPCIGPPCEYVLLSVLLVHHLHPRLLSSSPISMRTNSDLIFYSQVSVKMLSQSQPTARGVDRWFLSITVGVRLLAPLAEGGGGVHGLREGRRIRRVRSFLGTRKKGLTQCRMQEVDVPLKTLMTRGEANGSVRTRSRAGEAECFVVLRVGRTTIVAGGS